MLSIVERVTRFVNSVFQGLPYISQTALVPFELTVAYFQLAALELI